MKKWIPLLLLLLVSGAQAADGLVTVDSHHGVKKTVERLTHILEKEGFTIFAKINHSKAAEKVDMRLRPTRLLIFGKPKAGTKLMKADQSIGIDLPMKYLVWKDASDKVRIGWNDMTYLVKRHNIPGQSELAGKINTALDKMARKAAKK